MAWGRSASMGRQMIYSSVVSPHMFEHMRAKEGLQPHPFNGCNSRARIAGFLFSHWTKTRWQVNASSDNRTNFDYYTGTYRRVHWTHRPSFKANEKSFGWATIRWPVERISIDLILLWGVLHGTLNIVAKSQSQPKSFRWPTIRWAIEWISIDLCFLSASALYCMLYNDNKRETCDSPGVPHRL